MRLPPTLVAPNISWFPSMLSLPAEDFLLQNEDSKFPVRRNRYEPVSQYNIPDDFWQPVAVQHDEINSDGTSLQQNQHIPKDFWEPVSKQEADSLKKKGNTKQNKKEIIHIKDDTGFDGIIDLCLDDSLENKNNNGIPARNKHRSLQGGRSGKYKTVIDVSKQTEGKNVAENIRESRHSSQEKLQSIETDLASVSIFKPTTNERRVETERDDLFSKPILVDSDEERKQMRDLCSFFGSDSNVCMSDRVSKSIVKVTPTPSYPAYDIIKVLLDQEERCVDYIKGDGNCFFRALSKIIYDDETCHEEFRQAVIDLLEKYPKEFEQFIDGSVHEHIKSMRKPGTWATQAEIYVAATLLQRDIYVLSPDHTGEFYRWLLFSPRFSYPESEVFDKCYLTLCHTNGNHYDRITPKNKRCNCNFLPPHMSGVRAEVDLTDEIV